MPRPAGTCYSFFPPACPRSPAGSRSASVPRVADRRAAASGEAGASRPGGKHRRFGWIVPLALAAGAVACAAALAAGVGDFHWVTSSPATPPPTLAGGPGLVRVVSSSGQARADHRFQGVNGIADGLGNLWLTGAQGAQDHL